MLLELIINRGLYMDIMKNREASHAYNKMSTDYEMFIKPLSMEIFIGKKGPEYRESLTAEEIETKRSALLNIMEEFEPNFKIVKETVATYNIKAE